LGSRWQACLNVFAVLVTVGMLAALPDIRCILLPPAAPDAVVPSSPLPYELWVSLATKNPDCFQVMLESDFWANRRADVKMHEGGKGVPRAELRLQRQVNASSHNEEDGTVWVERRQRFLTRQFTSGERVGHFSISYLNRLGLQ
jgi:hypothetical protein